mgnify:CR=1 FL=1
MVKEDIALFVEIKKMKPLEVQEGLRIFRQIRAEQIKLDNQYVTPPPTKKTQVQHFIMTLHECRLRIEVRI